MLQDVDQDSEHLVCHTPFQSHAWVPQQMQAKAEVRY